MADIDNLRTLPIKPVVGNQVSVEDLIKDYRRMWGCCNAVHGLYKWYSVHLQKHVYVKTSKFYTPTIKDVGNILLVECAGKPLFYTQPVIPFRQSLPWHPRQMIDLKSSNNNVVGSLTGPFFRVLTYNMLADVCATEEQYPNCPSFALKWEHRQENLLKEILQYDVDIICLQELQQIHFSYFFYPELVKHGYEGVFKEKQRECYRPTVDGCATFYRRSQFDFLESQWVNLGDLGKYCPRFQKDNIALNVVLSFKGTNQCLCIANTHIHANQRNNDIKLWQVWYLLKYLEGLVEKNYGAPLVICGDFNSLPGSAPHSLLTKGYIHPYYTEILDYDPYGDLQFAKMFSHKIPLASAYSSYFECDVPMEHIVKKMNCETREPHFTNSVSNSKRKFQGTLDYILYTQTNLKVESLLELMDEEEVKDGALPSRDCSSNHIPLVTKFRYISPIEIVEECN